MTSGASISWPAFWTILILVNATMVGVGWIVASYRNLAVENTRLAAENEQMRLTDERMLRSRTNYRLPGVTEEEVEWIKKIADDYGMPPEVLYAMRRAENGGTGLMLGANRIPQEIRLRYPPKWWQFAMGAKVWTKHLNKVAINDPYLRHRTMWSFAKQWNPDPEHWTENVLAYLNESRVNGLAVTDPPRKAPAGAKANGGGQKPSKNSSKENKR